MRIAVYDCVTGDILTEKHGPTGETVIGWLAPHLPEAAFTSFHIAGNAQPPTPGAYDGVIVSGSEKGVYDDTEWIEPLRENLLAQRAEGTPIFGICFGHQIMADTFGGKAEKADTGYVVGGQTFDMAGASTPAYVAHQDQVTKVPPGAKIIASAPYCPVAALAYDGPALSVQFHPEYGAAFMKDLIATFGPSLASPEDVQTALDSVKDNVPKGFFADDVAAFFRRHNPMDT